MKKALFVTVAMALRPQRGSGFLDVLREAHGCVAAQFEDFELIVVTQPGMELLEQELRLEMKQLESIRHLRLATLVADDVAVSAAIENAIGDFVVVFAPEADPVAVIADVVQICRSGTDIVVGVAPQTRGALHALLHPGVHALLRRIGYDLPPDATRLRCLSRRAVNAVTQAGRFHHQLFVRMQKTGYPAAFHDYRLRPGSPVPGLSEMMREALRLMVFNSTRPLRWLAGAGLLLAGVCALTGAWRFTAALYTQGQWSAADFAMTVLSVMGALMFALLAFLGEYLGRLLDERGEQFVYAVSDEASSSVMLNQNRFNITSQSTHS